MFITMLTETVCFLKGNRKKIIAQIIIIKNKMFDFFEGVDLGSLLRHLAKDCRHSTYANGDCVRI